MGFFTLQPTAYPKAVVETTAHLPNRGESDWYEMLYKNMNFRDSSIAYIRRQGEKVYGYQEKYHAVQKQTGVPWYLIGSLHCLESSCDFRAVLHNGERIVGTKLKTRLVPRGRGPFATWEQAATDALRFDGLDGKKSWSIGEVLRHAERYNGLGYLKHHPDQLSPYVWACSDKCNLYGKYTSDGSYSTQARTDGQVGVAVIIKYLEQQNYIKLDYQTTMKVL